MEPMQLLHDDDAPVLCLATERLSLSRLFLPLFLSFPSFFLLFPFVLRTYTLASIRSLFRQAFESVSLACNDADDDYVYTDQ